MSNRKEINKIIDQQTAKSAEVLNNILKTSPRVQKMYNEVLKLSSPNPILNSL